MSVLDDLRGLDLSAIVNARGSIASVVANPQLQALISGGAAQSALGGLGQSLSQLQSNFTSPEALLQPVMNTLSGLSGALGACDLPIDRYASGVSEGIQVVLRIIDGLQSDPNNFGAALGGSLGGQIDSLSRFVSSYAQIESPDLQRVTGTLARLERGVSGSAPELADLALDVLSPFPRTALRELRTGLDGILHTTAQVQLPEGRLQGLQAALDAVDAAAISGNAGALQRALSELAQARDNTVHVLEQDLLAALQRFSSLRLDLVLAPMQRATEGSRVAQTGVLELLGNLRSQLAFVRTQIETADPAEIGAFLQRTVDMLAEQAQRHIVAPIDAAVAQLTEFVRGLFRQLPVRGIRHEITRFLHGIAQAVRDLGLEAAVQSVRDTLAQVRDLVSADGLAENVQAALNQVRATITGALGPVTDALEQISGRIDAIAGEAQAVLERAAQALRGFAAAMTQLQTAIDQLGIDAAAEQVVATLRTLREKAEALLSDVPLPEPMRPLVEQLIETLEGVDFDVVFQPLRAAVDQLQIPDEVRSTITDTLRELRDAITNLIPAELIASIEAEVNNALDVIRGFNPASLLPDVSEYLEQAAGFIEQLDPRQAVSALNGPFQTILEGIDAVQPRRLLAPVIEAYDSVLARITLPGPDLAMRRFSDLINAAGEATAQAVTTPARQLTQQLSASSGDAGGSAPAPGAGTPAPAAGGGGGAGTPLPESFRPGDVVRLFGYLPGKLREGLRALEAGAAGAALREIDSLTAGLARDLRRLQHELRQVEQRLLSGLERALQSLGERQLNAQANIRLHMRGSAGFDVEGAVQAVALAGPAALHGSLAQTRALLKTRVAEAVSSTGGALGAAFERAANAIESLQIARFTHNLDDFLASLDPEPLANDLDQLVRLILQRAPQLLTGLSEQLAAAVQRVTGIIGQLNPGIQAQKFGRILAVLKEELDVLNPSVLADELGEIHAAVRRSIAAFDPAVLAEDLFAIVQECADTIRGLDPQALLGDLSFLDDILDRVAAAVPAAAFEGVGAALSEVGEQLVALDPGALLDSVEQLGPRILDQTEDAVSQVRDEIVALLESVRYASQNAGGSASVSLGAGG